MTTVPQSAYILLIDDDTVTNFLHKSLIKDLNKGYEVVIAENGLEAHRFLEKAMAQQVFPQLILVDLNMPVMDGFTFLERYLANNYHVIYPTRLSVLTTSSNPSDSARLQQLDFVSYLAKPLTKQSLVNWINS